MQTPDSKFNGAAEVTSDKDVERQLIDVRRVRLLFLLACVVFVSLGLVAAWFAPFDPQERLTGLRRFILFLGSSSSLLVISFAVAFVLFGIWYLRFLAVPAHPVSADAVDAKLRQDSRLLGLVLVAFVLSLASVSYLFIHDMRILFRDEKLRDLSTVARLKAQQVDGWIAQHTRDAQALARAIRSLPIGTLSLEGEARQIVDVLLGAVLAGTTDRTGVSLVRPDGKLLISLGEDGVPDENTIAAVTAVEASPPRFRIVDVHEVAGPRPLVRMSFIVPVDADAGSDAPTMLVLVLTVDPMREMFTQVVSWPAASPDSEVVLVRRSGDDVLYLTPPSKPGAERILPLSYRLPLARNGLTEAQAILQGDATREGVNAGGHPVFSASYHVTGVPWFVVATIEVDTFMAPIREKTIALMIAMLGIILVAVFMVLLLWRGQRGSYLSFRDQQFRERAELLARLEKHIP